MLKRFVSFLLITTFVIIDAAPAMKGMKSSQSYEDLRMLEARSSRKPSLRRSSFSARDLKNKLEHIDNQSLQPVGFLSYLPVLPNAETIDELSPSSKDSPSKESHNPSSNETSFSEDLEGLKLSSSQESLKHSHSSGLENEKEDGIPSSPESRNSSTGFNKTLEEFETKEKSPEASIKQNQTDEDQIQENALNSHQTPKSPAQTGSDEILPIGFDYEDFLKPLPKKQEIQVNQAALTQQDGKDAHLISLNPSDPKSQKILLQSSSNGEVKKEEKNASTFLISSSQPLNDQPAFPTAKEKVQKIIHDLLEQTINFLDEKKKASLNAAVVPVEDKKDKGISEHPDTLSSRSSEEDLSRSNSEEDLGSNTQGSPITSPLNGSPQSKSPIQDETEGSPKQLNRDRREGAQTDSLNNSPKTEEDILSGFSSSSIEEEIRPIDSSSTNITRGDATPVAFLTTKGNSLLPQQKLRDKSQTQELHEPWQDAFRNLKEKENRNSTLQPRGDIEERFTEKSSLLPQKGSIQTYDAVEDGFVWIMDAQQGSFSTRYSAKSFWLSKIPLLSWLEDLLDRNPSKKEKSKNSKAKSDLIIDPSVQEDAKEDESVPTHHLKGTEPVPQPSLKANSDETKEKARLIPVTPTIATKLANNPTIYGTGGDDPEKGKGGMVLTLPEDLDPRVRAFLVYAKDYINDGKITLKQGLLGGIGGTLIGVGVGNAMPAIFFDGLEGLGRNFHYEMEWGNLGLAYSFLAHTAITLGIDSISRNVIIIGDLAGPSMGEFSIPSLRLKYKNMGIDPRKGALLLVYAGAGFAALLPVYYLWHIEENLAEKHPEQKKSYYTFFWWLAPALWLDSLLQNSLALNQWVDQKFNNSLIGHVYAAVSFSLSAKFRQEKLNSLSELKRLFKSMNNDEIDDMYEQILVKGLSITKNGIDIPTDNIKALDALRTLKVLKQIHKDHQIPEGDKEKENWKNTAANALGWAIPSLATVGRSFVFYVILSHLLNDIGLAHGAANITFSVIFGGIIASLFQGKAEVDAVKEGVYDLLFGNDIEGDASYSRLRNGLRKIGKGYNYIQGAWNTLPYLLVGILATENWSLSWQIATLLPFGIADMFNNVISFHESYGGAVSGAESLLSYKYASSTYKRNKLVKLIRNYIKAFETMHPDVLLKLYHLETKED